MVQNLIFFRGWDIKILKFVVIRTIRFFEGVSVMFWWFFIYFFRWGGGVDNHSFHPTPRTSCSSQRFKLFRLNWASFTEQCSEININNYELVCPESKDDNIHIRARGLNTILHLQMLNTFIFNFFLKSQR